MNIFAKTQLNSLREKGKQMNNLDIFTIIAQTAIVTGCHVRLEQKDYEGDASVVGNMSKSHRTDRGLVLEVYPPGPDEAAVDEEEADDE